MEFVYVIIGIVILLLIVRAYVGSTIEKTTVKSAARQYFYARKDAVMSEAEAKFFHRLQAVAGSRYFVFPQIRLSSLVDNRSKGRSWKPGLNRINQKSVDYVFCDKDTMRPIYAVELDDATHDTEKRRMRDALVEDVLAGVELPLVRFRNFGNMSDDDIARRFEEAAAR